MCLIVYILTTKIVIIKIRSYGSHCGFLDKLDFRWSGSILGGITALASFNELLLVVVVVYVWLTL